MDKTGSGADAKMLLSTPRPKKQYVRRRRQRDRKTPEAERVQRTYKSSEILARQIIVAWNIDMNATRPDGNGSQSDAIQTDCG